MKNIWRDIWIAANTPIKVPLLQAGTWAADSGTALISLADELRESQNSERIGAYASSLSSLLEILDLPFVRLTGGLLPFIPVAVEILKYLSKSIKQNPNLEICVAIVSQAAYLESFQQLLHKEVIPELSAEVLQASASQNTHNQILQLGNGIFIGNDELIFDIREAEKTIVCFHESILAVVFNEILSSRLLDLNLNIEQVDLLVEKVSRSAFRYMRRTLSEVGQTVPRLSSIIGGDWNQELRIYRSLDDYLVQEIAPRTSKQSIHNDWQIFNEYNIHDPEKPVIISDLYVPLKGVLKSPANIPSEGIISEDLSSTVIRLIKGEGKVILLQGDPGRGKSVFCKIFSDSIRREVHPIWTPILIKLSSIESLEYGFEEILERAVGWEFAHGNWLTDRNTRFLFILDGFDDLLLKQKKNQDLQDFLWRAKYFQDDCNRNPMEKGHRLIITSRPILLQGLQNNIPPDIDIIDIFPFDKEQQNQWIRNWGNIQGEDKSINFSEWLMNDQCPQTVRELAQEPLLLYLLAAMHRSGELGSEIFDGLKGKTEKISVYEKFVDWVLKYRRPEWLANSQEQIAARKRVLKEMGLCVVHSGTQTTSISIVENRLSEDAAAQEVLIRAKREIEVNPIRTSIVSFFFKSVPEHIEMGSEVNNIRKGSIEFIHSSFSEFLFAERLVDTFEDWVERRRGNKEGYYISDEIVSRQVYEMLGYGELTHEVVEFIIGITVKRFEIEDWSVLFDRLEAFYLSWSKGDFIELTNRFTQIPLELAQEFRSRGIFLGQRQVDIYTGLNVLIILFSLHRYAQQVEISTLPEVDDRLVFRPCGKKGIDNFDELRLQRVISYSDCLRPSAFSQIVGGFLQGANLSDIVLQRVNLSGANLFEADLSKSDFRRADLSGANLSKASLREAYLRGADLDRANLRQANLTRADLKRAYFVSANLSDANFTKADLGGADLRDAILFDSLLNDAVLPGVNLTDIQSDFGTRWLNVRGLHKANGVPENLKNNPQFSTAVELSEAVELLLRGDIETSRKIYRSVRRKAAESEKNISASLWNKLAWVSCLHGYRDGETLAAAEQAVNMEPGRGNYIDTLAVIYATHGRFKDAIEQLEKVFESSDFEELDKALVDRRKKWLALLREDINPFSEEELNLLLLEELE